ncbi:arsenate-mycothiol transferase ArsC [Portibacter marinus]|uniref:arsenate-mycothiol transferase ArsC n=1 Tax=Portibacter marinus TaxID=2898660 RepID=UPI001F2C7891|nr:protein-tyrosine-phosphatase [Portibacter marinus]
MIEEQRRSSLEKLASVIDEQIQNRDVVLLNFICTHNSRRSHLAQIWAQVTAIRNGNRKVHCFSGGTEATAVHPMIIRTLINQGFLITKISDGDNPVYGVKSDPNAPPWFIFSKKYDHPINPSGQFIAIMTCDEADENCPIIPTADHRFAITYKDPKAADDRPDQKQVYLERSEQIKEEMEYLFGHIGRNG